MSTEKAPWPRLPVPDPWPAPEVAAQVIEPDDERVPTSARASWRKAMAADYSTVVLTYARGTVAWDEPAPRGEAGRVRRPLAVTRVVDSVILWLEHGGVRAWISWEDGKAADASVVGEGLGKQAEVWTALGQGAVWVALEGADR